LRDACRPARVAAEPRPVTAVAVPPPDATEAQVKDILAQAGLPIPESTMVSNSSEAHEAVLAVGGRAVFKAVVPGLLHKSDAGGVVIDVVQDGAAAAFEQCAALGGEVLVERFVPGGVEVLVSVSPSPLGRVVTVGVGGVLTEVMADVAVTLAPVSGEDIEELLDRTRVGTLLAGVRGGVPADRAALVSVIERVAQTVAQWPQDMELELNPVSVLADGCWILDAVAHCPTFLDSTNDRGDAPQGEGEN
jgi:succinyl-CoA synthetase beta subunit